MPKPDESQREWTAMLERIAELEARENVRALQFSDMRRAGDALSTAVRSNGPVTDAGVVAALEWWRGAESRSWCPAGETVESIAAALPGL